ncbi:DUF968 domain-containing protein [Salinicola sp. CR57]|uniref:DUF968 domain-containing protein n=1 Tax=Salinicola sp. CR57 TaxID=1949086 RepID=UPI000DA1B8A8|nr:DUF968 domain-containing protein [Salinicola sp. CR57]
MKRTALKRKTALTARQPMRRQCTAPRRRESQPKPRKAATQFRSPIYLRWVRSMPCCVCLQDATDAHHVIGLGWGLSGMGMTAPDSFAMPACRECHGDIHRDPELQRHQSDWLLQIIGYGLRQFPAGPIHDALLGAQAFIQAKQETA